MLQRCQRCGNHPHPAPVLAVNHSLQPTPALASAGHMAATAMKTTLELSDACKASEGLLRATAIWLPGRL